MDPIGIGITNDYYQVITDNIFSVINLVLKAPSKSKYAAKMEYIKQKNQIDQAKTSFVCTKSRRFVFYFVDFVVQTSVRAFIGKTNIQD